MGLNEMEMMKSRNRYCPREKGWREGWREGWRRARNKDDEGMKERENNKVSKQKQAIFMNVVQHENKFKTLCCLVR